MMRVLISIVERAVVVALAAMLPACAASGPSLPSAAFVGSPDTPNKPNGDTSLSAPTDVASLPGDAGQVSDPFEKMNRSVAIKQVSDLFGADRYPSLTCRCYDFLDIGSTGRTG